MLLLNALSSDRARQLASVYMVLGGTVDSIGW